MLLLFSLLFSHILSVSLSSSFVSPEFFDIVLLSFFKLYSIVLNFLFIILTFVNTFFGFCFIWFDTILFNNDSFIFKFVKNFLFAFWDLFKNEPLELMHFLFFWFFFNFCFANILFVISLLLFEWGVFSLKFLSFFFIIFSKVSFLISSFIFFTFSFISSTFNFLFDKILSTKVSLLFFFINVGFIGILFLFFSLTWGVYNLIKGFFCFFCIKGLIKDGIFLIKCI